MYEEAWYSHHCFVKLSGWFAMPPIFYRGIILQGMCSGGGGAFYKDLFYNDLFYKELFYKDLF